MYKCTGIAHYYKNSLISLNVVTGNGQLLDLFGADGAKSFSSREEMIRFIIDLSANNDVYYKSIKSFGKTVYNIIFYDVSDLSCIGRKFYV